MDENYASYYIDDQHYGTSYNDNPDIQGDDAKQFVFGSDWETWGGDEFGWY